jgi:hypothetical protein
MSFTRADSKGALPWLGLTRYNRVPDTPILRVDFLTFPFDADGSSPLSRNSVFPNGNPATGGPELELGYSRSMPADLAATLLSVWQQSLIDKKKTVELGGETYSVRQTAKNKLKQVDFRFEGRELRGLEQNPNTKSRWAKMAREGGQVMQFLERGKYIAVVVDGKIHVYR